MAVILEGGCRVSEMYEGDAIVNGTARIWNQIGRATGAQAISLRVMEFAPGLSPAIQNGDCDEILYVLDRHHDSSRTDRDEVSTTRVSGSVHLLIDGAAYPVGPDTGIYIRPHQTFAVNNARPDSIVIISSQCPDPNLPPTFVDRVNASPESSAFNREPIVRLADRPARPTADRWYRVLVDDEVGSEQVTQFVGSIPPGRAPDHFHNYEEVLFILKGEGRMWAGESNTPIAAGTCIYLPKGQVHCVENTGVGELRLLGVFYPAGSPSVRYDM
jgi:mannose-6-phosphate isomerase-like protein (cupin superfamily)